jgi:selenocysteine lyase/cysteine desulfurase
MAFDLDRLRAETPGVAHRIHLNNASASLMPAPVLDTMIARLRREAEIDGYEAAAEASERIDGIYDQVARLIGASQDEIALTPNAPSTTPWRLGSRRS